MYYLKQLTGLASVCVVVYLAGLFFGLFAWGWWGLDPRFYGWCGVAIAVILWVARTPEDPDPLHKRRK